MKSLLDKLFKVVFERLPLVKKLNGKKTYLGLALLALIYLAEWLSTAASFVPELAPYALSVNGLVQSVKPYFDTMGWTLVGVGAVHSKIKEKTDE